MAIHDMKAVGAPSYDARFEGLPTSSLGTWINEYN
jgi:hypothetical protein